MGGFEDILNKSIYCFPTRYLTNATQQRQQQRQFVSKASWRNSQSNDQFVRKRHLDDFRSRSAYKLDALNDKHKFLTREVVVLDLGSAPGGWTEVCMRKGVKMVIAVDMLPIEPFSDSSNVVILQGDMTSPSVWNDIKSHLESEFGADSTSSNQGNEYRVVDVVLSDMAHSFTGNQATDHLKVMGLAETALYVATQLLKPGGTFCVKILRGEGEQEFRDTLRKKFKTVKYEKPLASRKDSAEGYYVCLGFQI